MTPNDTTGVSSDEDAGVGIVLHRSRLAPRVGDLGRAVGRHEPPFRLGTDRLAESCQAFRVGGLGAADNHSTTTPAPPRLGSPAAASLPSANVTADAPPK